MKEEDVLKGERRRIIHQIKQDLWKEIELVLAGEINQARKDGQPTSRITSAFNKIKEILK